MTTHYRKIISVNDDPSLTPLHSAVLGAIAQGSAKGLTQNSVFEIISFLIGQGWPPLDKVEVQGVGMVVADLEVAGMAYEGYSSRWYATERGWSWLAESPEYFSPQYLYDLWTCSSEWLRRQDPPQLHLSLVREN